MAPSKRTPTLAEVALVPLKSCLVNLPSPLVSLLVNANTVSKMEFYDLRRIANCCELACAKRYRRATAPWETYIRLRSWEEWTASAEVNACWLDGYA